MLNRYVEEIVGSLDEDGDLPLTLPTLMALITSGAYIIMVRDLFDDWNDRTWLGKTAAVIGFAFYMAMLPAAIVLFVAGVLMALLELTPRVLLSAYQDHAFVAQKTNRGENDG